MLKSEFPVTDQVSQFGHERMSRYVHARRQDPAQCVADPFCNGKVVDRRLCAGHLQLAQRAEAHSARNRWPR